MTTTTAEFAPATSAVRRWAILLCLLLASAGFIALGIWQLQRREWKLDLIERVTQRVHAAPMTAPGPDEWSGLTAANAEYRHVSITGRFLHDQETQVHAATALGTGYWVVTPLQTDAGAIVLINRGYVSMDDRDPARRPPAYTNSDTETVTITGLLRITEPGGAYLRRNDPAANRWYSRDVVAIAQARSLDAVHLAPYFIDADAASNMQPGQPVAGLTVVSFHNNHLSYAFTWFALALLPPLGLLFTIRRERRLS
ncbi:MAG: SURF1 family protein [Steroidobacteraceae bacterium]